LFTVNPNVLPSPLVNVEVALLTEPVITNEPVSPVGMLLVYVLPSPLVKVCNLVVLLNDEVSNKLPVLVLPPLPPGIVFVNVLPSAFVNVCTLV